MGRLPKKVRRYLSSLGKKGARARAKRLSPEQRREIARRAALARWRRQKDQTVEQ